MPGEAERKLWHGWLQRFSAAVVSSLPATLPESGQPRLPSQETYHALLQHERLIRGHAEAFAAFHRLLVKLAAEQDQGALALLSGLSST